EALDPPHLDDPITNQASSRHASFGFQRNRSLLGGLSWNRCSAFNKKKTTAKARFSSIRTASASRRSSGVKITMTASKSIAPLPSLPCAAKALQATLSNVWQAWRANENYGFKPAARMPTNGGARPTNTADCSVSHHSARQ